MVGVTTELICNWVITIIKLVIWKVVFFFLSHYRHPHWVLSYYLHETQFATILPGFVVERSRGGGEEEENTRRHFMMMIEGWIRSDWFIISTKNQPPPPLTIIPELCNLHLLLFLQRERCSLLVVHVIILHFDGWCDHKRSDHLWSSGIDHCAE